MKYKAYLTQEGEGCDYTIGCARTVIDIDAPNMEDAKIKLMDIIQEDYRGDSKLKSCDLFEINHIYSFNTKELYASFDAMDNFKKEKSQEDKDREEYERLKIRFENKIIR